MRCANYSARQFIHLIIEDEFIKFDATRRCLLDAFTGWFRGFTDTIRNRNAHAVRYKPSSNHTDTQLRAGRSFDYSLLHNALDPRCAAWELTLPFL